MVRDASTRYEHLRVALGVDDGIVVGEVAARLSYGGLVAIRADDVKSVDFNVGVLLIHSPIYGDLVHVGPRIANGGLGGGVIPASVGETGIARVSPSGEGVTARVARAVPPYVQ